MPLLEVRRLVKHFVRRQGLFRAPSVVRAVDDVSFAIEEGEMFGLVGESGSGKSTTGRCILRLIEPTSGEVIFRGENVLGYSHDEMRQARRQMQIVFQDPYSSLNPRMRVRQRVITECVTFAHDSAYERRVFTRLRTDHEERGSHTPRGEHLDDLGGELRAGTGVQR